MDEEAILVGVQLDGQNRKQIERSLDELGQLAKTAGAEVTGKVVQKKDRPNVRTFIGPGKVSEVKAALKDKTKGMAIFDDELSPSQQLNLELAINKKIVDRTGLILDIFSQHAHSAEGKIQVELAQLNYYMPRLRGLGIEMSRLGGGIGTRGPGETQLETDRRRLFRRIKQLEKELDKLFTVRDTQRKRREKADIFTVSLVGYTNVGKSSLINELTGSSALVEDKLFATLDSTSRKVSLPSGKSAVISDTVGFIDKLPHELVAAFKSTMDEIRYSDLILHVIDASDLDRKRHIDIVSKILNEIDVETVPIIEVFNKVDLVDEFEKEQLDRREDSVIVSAAKGTHIADVLKMIDNAMSHAYKLVKLAIPYEGGSLRMQVFEKGNVISEYHDEEKSIIEVELKDEDLKRLSKFQIE